MDIIPLEAVLGIQWGIISLLVFAVLVIILR
jgi:hypothetical protein